MPNDLEAVVESAAPPSAEATLDLKVFEGIEMRGHVNTDDDTIRQHVEHSIRLGYPQVKPQPPQAARVCLVGGGPSLDYTFEELRDLYFAGAKVVTVNGSYAWCLERNIRPSAHIVLDARADNARFIGPAVPQCHYLIASQCHPDTWAKVAGREQVWIWHAAARDNDTLRPVLDAFYLGNWAPTPGGTTVIMRALAVLSMIGYLRFDLFGVDSCYLEGRNHAYAQPENDLDRPYPFLVHPTGHPDLGRTFLCAPWHAKQLECFLQLIRINGNRFLINVHGDGLLAFALRACAQVEVQQLPRPDAATQGG